MHHRIGLEPRWYIGGYNYVLNHLIGLAIAANRWSHGKLGPLLAAVTQRVMLDMDIAISGYQEALLVERQQRGRRVDALLREFEATTGSLVGTVAAAATQLRATAQSLSSTTEQTTGQAAGVAAAVEEASVNVQTVAAATEELSSFDLRDRAAGRTVLGDRQPRGAGCAAHRHDRQDAGRRGAEDRRRGRPDQQHRRADQPAGAERDDRGGTRRRCRQGLRGGGVGSEEPRQPDGEGDRATSARRSRGFSRRRPRPSRRSKPSPRRSTS